MTHLVSCQFQYSSIKIAWPLLHVWTSGQLNHIYRMWHAHKMSACAV